MIDKNIIDSMKIECKQEYPMPYFSSLKEEMTDLFEQLKEEYKDASLHFFLDYGYAICLDNISRAYYAAVPSRGKQNYGLYELHIQNEYGRQNRKM